MACAIWSHGAPATLRLFRVKLSGLQRHWVALRRFPNDLRPRSQKHVLTRTRRTALLTAVCCPCWRRSKCCQILSNIVFFSVLFLLKSLTLWKDLLPKASKATHDVADVALEPAEAPCLAKTLAWHYKKKEHGFKCFPLGLFFCELLPVDQGQSLMFYGRVPVTETWVLLLICFRIVSLYEVGWRERERGKSPSPSLCCLLICWVQFLAALAVECLLAEAGEAISSATSGASGASSEATRASWSCRGRVRTGPNVFEYFYVCQDFSRY